MGQQGLPELWALVKDGPQLLGWELQDDLEALGLGALTALDEALPHLGILPHLGPGREGAVVRGPAGSEPPQKLGQRPYPRPCLAAFSPPPLEGDVSPAKPTRPGEVRDSSRVTQVPRAELTARSACICT